MWGCGFWWRKNDKPMVRNSLTAALACAVVALSASSCAKHSSEPLSLWMARSEMARSVDPTGLQLVAMSRVADSFAADDLNSYVWQWADSLISERSVVQAYMADTMSVFDPEANLYRRRSAVADTALCAWSVDNGRRLLSLVDAVEAGQGGDSLKVRLNAVAQTLMRLRDDKTGMWRRLLDCPGGDANTVEATSSALIVYAVLKGSRLGLLPSEMRAQAEECFSLFVEMFVRIGEKTGDGRNLLTVTQCHMIGDKSPDNDPEAVGAFTLACLEVGM